MERTLIRYAAVGLVMTLVVVISSFSQENVTRVEDSAFKKPMRPPVRFLHDKHNEKAKIDECHTCHHVYEKGIKRVDSSSEDRKCSECHKITDDDSMPLVKAYHGLCKGCHVEKNAGPVMCAECHQKE